MVEEVARLALLMSDGDRFHNSNYTISFKNLSGRFDCNSDHLVYLLLLMFTNAISKHMHANARKILLIKG